MLHDDSCFGTIQPAFFSLENLHAYSTTLSSIGYEMIESFEVISATVIRLPLDLQQFPDRPRELP